MAATTNTQKTLLATSFSNLDKISQARTIRRLTAREDAGRTGDGFADGGGFGFQGFAGLGVAEGAALVGPPHPAGAALLVGPLAALPLATPLGHEIWAVIFLTSSLVLGTVIIYGVEKPILH